VGTRGGHGLIMYSLPSEVGSTGSGEAEHELKYHLYRIQHAAMVPNVVNSSSYSVGRNARNSSIRHDIKTTKLPEVVRY
jgi:hypothetical protein